MLVFHGSAVNTDRVTPTNCNFPSQNDFVFKLHLIVNQTRPKGRSHAKDEKKRNNAGSHHNLMKYALQIGVGLTPPRRTDTVNSLLYVVKGDDDNTLR